MTDSPVYVQTSFASSVISALSTLETGQFCSASCAIRANVSCSRFGTLARSVRAERLIRKDSLSCSRVTAASVWSSVGVYPAACNRKANAIVKHPACAAAISSSGLVPFSLSNRVLNEYGVSASTPESDDRLPFPPRPVPYQTALALRITERSPLSNVSRTLLPNCLSRTLHERPAPAAGWNRVPSVNAASSRCVGCVTLILHTYTAVLTRRERRVRALGDFRCIPHEAERLRDGIRRIEQWQIGGPRICWA